MHNELYHHGVLGQKWGVRRYQNPDGSLTSLGKSHAQEQNVKEFEKLYKKNYRKINMQAGWGGYSDKQYRARREAEDALGEFLVSKMSESDIKKANELYKKLGNNNKDWDAYFAHKKETIKQILGEYGDKEIKTPNGKRDVSYLANYHSDYQTAIERHIKNKQLNGG